MNELLTTAGLTALGTVILIDLVMSGDNAIVIGLAATGLNPKHRRKAIVFGIALAALLRAGFAAVAVQLLTIIGLTLAGGILLLWVAWKMYREIRALQMEQRATRLGAEIPRNKPGKTVKMAGKSFGGALTTIVLADVSMSLDNVLAVAGAARENLIVLGIGLGLSVALMGIAANYIARLLERFHWLAFVGLIIVFYVAVDMIFRGAVEVSEEVAALAALAPI